MASFDTAADAASDHRDPLSTDYVAASVTQNHPGDNDELRSRMHRWVSEISDETPREWLALLPVGVVILNDEGIVIDANPFAIDLLGTPLLFERWRDCVDRVFAPRTDDGHEISLRDGRRVKLTTRALTESSRAHHEGQENGVCSGGQIIALVDLTDSRELQQSLAQNERLASMGRLMANLAHQLRTPLATAILHAHHLQELDTHTGSRLIERLQFIERQISDLLLVAGGGAPLVETLAVAQLLKHLRGQFESHLQQHNIRLQLDGELLRAQLIGNQDALQGALSNLIENAAQACAMDNKPEHVISVSARRRNHYIDIVVSDNGCGMSELVRARALEPFFSTKRKGSGLGLAVVNAVVQSHAGSLTIASKAGEGSTFCLRLPLAPCERQQVVAA